MNTKKENNLLLIAIKACLKAGKAIVDIYNSDIQVDFKLDKSPLTNADLSSNESIIKVLKQTNIPILSEEGAQIPFLERSNWNEFWLIDPLDGTKEFINRNGEFTVNVALIKDQKSILGVVYTPATDELFFGEEKVGAYKVLRKSIKGESSIEDILEKSQKIEIASGNKSKNVMVSRSHLDERTISFIQDIEKDRGIKTTQVPAGSSLKICRISEGKAFMYPRFGRTMEWDIAAGHAVLRAAGGKIVDIDKGKELVYNKEDLAINGFIAWNE